VYALKLLPDLTSLRLGGCTQFSAALLAAAAPSLRGLVYLDLEYCSAVDDGVAAALGAHCGRLQQLQLIGCHKLTDAALGAGGLLGACTRLRGLNLRGCKAVGDAGVLALAARAPGLREVNLAGLTTVTAPALAALLAAARGLVRFKAEIWSEAPAPDGAGGAPKRSYRLLSSVRAATRYLRPAVPADHPAAALLPFNFAADRKPAARSSRADRPPGKLLPSAEYARSDLLRLDDADAANRRWQELAGVWRVLEGGLEVTAFHKLSDEQWEGVAHEAKALLKFLRARDRRVFFRHHHWWNKGIEGNPRVFTE
jgi:hypothetical protein